MNLPSPPPGTAAAVASLAAAATDLERASRELVRGLRALGQERMTTATALRESLRETAAAEARHWTHATAATTEVCDQLAEWIVRRDARAERLAADAAQIRKAVGRLATESVGDGQELAGQFADAAAQASARWTVLDARVDGIGDFLHLLAREQQTLQQRLATLSGLLEGQQNARNRLRAVAVQDDANAASAEGSRALQRGDLTLAEELFRRAWTLDGTSCSRHNLALVLLLSGQHPRAAELLAGADPPDADPVARQSLLALRAYQDGHFDEARREAEAGLAVDPGHALLRHLAAAAAARRGATAEALRLGGDWSPAAERGSGASAGRPGAPSLIEGSGGSARRP